MYEEDENPLDKSVRIICEHKEFISKPHVAMLMNVFPLDFLKEFLPAPDGTVSKAQSSLANQLQRMLKVQEQLMNTAIASDDADLKKKALSGGKDLFNLFAKFERLIDRQARQAMIESSVKEAFAELKNPELEQKYLSILHEKLRIAAKTQ
jgi:hypothetical protein